MASNGPDIFRQMNQLFRGEAVEGEVNTFVLHRFLASEQVFAAAAKQIGSSVREDSLVVGVWQTSLPRLRQAPFFKWPAPKRPPALVPLAARIAEVENLSPTDLDDVMELLTAAGGVAGAAAHYGVELKEVS